LAAATTPHRLLVTDGVFSVDGDLAPLAALHAVARAHDALLVVDEAHALGVIGPEGRGAVEAAGLAGEPSVVRTVVLSKSLGAQGGAVVGAPEVIELLVSTARPFIFDTGLAPAAVGGALAALGILAAEPERVAAVRSAAARLAEVVRALGVESIEPDAAVVPAFLGDPLRAVAAAAACLEQGVRVGCFRPPSVPAGRACLRMTARATLTDADLARVADVLAAVLA
ncbi:MAG TPA: aminotransferase class I/II-fold pyridoxal phosphate-dependent enzyme, partial [Jatrophihabitans sp.]|nr:aminotransferase class I/II-fold pyridoxal phosphate-dependent enzyme [Jatrophihabitans sp.]